jgi:hypothetical protein
LGHPEQPGRQAARLLADDPDIKPRHFGDVRSTGKLLNLVPKSLFRSFHKSLETAKIIHKILVDDLIFTNLQFCSIGKFN